MPFGFGSMLGLAGLEAAVGISEGRKNRRAARDARAEDAALQREFAQHGVRWRVEDAKAAGVHPLLALGGSGAMASPSPIAVGGDDSASQAAAAIGRSVRSQMTAEEQLLHRAQLLKLGAESDKDFAIASYYRSEAKRGEQSNPSKAVVYPYGSAPAGHPLQSGAVELFADPQASRNPHRPSRSAGVKPAFMEVQISDDGTTMLVPWSEEGVGESLEGPAAWALTIYANVKRQLDRARRSGRTIPDLYRRGIRR